MQIMISVCAILIRRSVCLVQMMFFFLPGTFSLVGWEWDVGTCWSRGQLCVSSAVSGQCQYYSSIRYFPIHVFSGMFSHRELVLLLVHEMVFRLALPLSELEELDVLPLGVCIDMVFPPLYPSVEYLLVLSIVLFLFG